jgi:signal transduction histidine kinase
MVIYGELLEDVADDLPANPRAWIKRVAHATRHQHRLVEQILTYKRMQVDDAVRAEPLDFRDIVGPAVDMARAATRDRPVAIDVDIPDVPLDGTCDRGMLVQIATNLLSNAVRFTPEGRVRFAVRADGDLVCLTVQDEGIGIRADDLPHIFERFWRGHQREDGGSCGLGLTITRELVDRLAGRVEVESKPGHGSTFRVWIPRTSPGSPIPARS